MTNRNEWDSLPSTSTSLPFDNEVWKESCIHDGPKFYPKYKKLPDSIKFRYNRKVMELSEDAEEAACLYAEQCGKKYKIDQIFNDNFFGDWSKIMTKYEQQKITDLKKCDFNEIQDYLLKKPKSKKKKDKNYVCLIDGKEEPIENHLISGPSLFKGRGRNQNRGCIKRRITPEDVIINCSSGARIIAPDGKKWKGTTNNNKVIYLASWKDNVREELMYMQLAPWSTFRLSEDRKKYEKVHSLKDKIDEIRSDYKLDWDSQDIINRQRGVALYFIDTFLFRAGHEKNENKDDNDDDDDYQMEEDDIEDDTDDDDGDEYKIEEEDDENEVQSEDEDEDEIESVDTKSDESIDEDTDKDSNEYEEDEYEEEIENTNKDEYEEDEDEHEEEYEEEIENTNKDEDKEEDQSQEQLQNQSDQDNEDSEGNEDSENNEGNENDNNTYGCCSLRVKHIDLSEENHVLFNFLGKSSIFYQQKKKVDPIVYKNLKLFILDKKRNRKLFDKLDVNLVNKYLKEKMDGLTCKVFRTYNASVKFEEYLEELTNLSDTNEQKIKSYNEALKKVQEECNHTTENTTKENYLDPRITYAWCIKYSVSVTEKMITPARKNIFGNDSNSYKDFSYRKSLKRKNSEVESSNKKIAF